MLLHRVLSAIVGIPMLISAVWMGSYYLAGITALVVGIGLIEFKKMADEMQVRAWLPGMFTGAFLFLASAFFPEQIILSMTITVLVVIILLPVIFSASGFGLLDSAVSLFGTVYIGWLLSHVVFLRELELGFYFVLFVFVTTWMTDTAAYFTGKSIGKHKLAPKISPKKTIEGSIGGVIGSMLGALVFAYFVNELSYLHAIILGTLVGIIGQVGDLIESAMKRKAGIKDSGNLIPGHGGVLDRFDSLLLTIPLVYYYVQVFIIN